MDQHAKYSFRSFSEFYKYGPYIILIHELLGIFLATIACLAGSFLMMGDLVTIQLKQDVLSVIFKVHQYYGP